MCDLYWTIKVCVSSLWVSVFSKVLAYSFYTNSSSSSSVLLFPQKHFSAYAFIYEMNWLTSKNVLWTELIELVLKSPFYPPAMEICIDFRFSGKSKASTKKWVGGEGKKVTSLPQIILFAILKACCYDTIHVWFIFHQRVWHKTHQQGSRSLECQCSATIHLASCCSFEKCGLCLIVSLEGIEAPSVAAQMTGLPQSSALGFCRAFFKKCFHSAWLYFSCLHPTFHILWERLFHIADVNELQADLKKDR